MRLPAACTRPRVRSRADRPLVTEPVAYGVTRKPNESWRQVIVRMAESPDRVQQCLAAYQELLAEFTDPDEGARADAAWDALLLGGCLAGVGEA